VHLVGFTIEIYYDARPYERQIWLNVKLSLSTASRRIRETEVKIQSFSTSAPEEGEWPTSRPGQ